MWQEYEMPTSFLAIVTKVLNDMTDIGIYFLAWASGERICLDGIRCTRPRDIECKCSLLRLGNEGLEYGKGGVLRSSSALSS